MRAIIEHNGTETPVDYGELLQNGDIVEIDGNRFRLHSRTFVYENDMDYQRHIENGWPQYMEIGVSARLSVLRFRSDRV